MKSTISLLCFLIAYSTVSIEAYYTKPCDETSKESKLRILGGKPTKIENFPHHVSVQHFSEKGVYFCGGSIISDHWVVTAGHCVDGSDNPEDYFIRSGSSYRRWGGNDHQVEKVVRHIDYKLLSDDVRAENDIGLVKVKKSFIFGKRCKPIQMYDTFEEVEDNAQGVVVGWGKKSNGWYSSDLQLLTLPIINKETCNEMYEEKYGGICDNQICAGYKNDSTKNVCHGDSGGALVVNNRLAGVTSWVGEPCGEPQSPAVFTEISQYRIWVDENIDEGLFL